MAYQEHGMWEVLDILKRIHRGESRRAVSRATGRCPKTIRRYLSTAADLGWVVGVHEPDETLAAAVIARHRPGRSESETETSQLLALWSDQLQAWLKPHDNSKRGLRLTKIFRLLQRHGVDVSYIALYRHCREHFDLYPKPSTVRMAEVAPGEVAEVDFGRLGYIYDTDAQKRRAVHALIVTLVHSRHQYVHVCHTQKLEDVMDGLEDAWEYFGGVPRRLIVDNMKTAITKSDRYDPIFQRVFGEYAEHRDFVIDATVARHPTGKPHVERQVQYVRESFFRGEKWIGLAHVQREAVKWCTHEAGGRIHGTTHKQPLVEFERVEREALNPLLGERFDTPQWGTPKVHPDQHIRFLNALYSVPHQHEGKPTRGQNVDVRGDRRLVRIYLRGTLIKTHPRRIKGGRSTDPADYPEEKTTYAMRDINRIIATARGKSRCVGIMAERLLSGDCPWSRIRSAQKLLRMCDKYGVDVIESACRRALAFDLINVKRVERIIEQGLTAPAIAERPSSNVIQMPLRFARPSESFNHNKENPHGTQPIPKTSTQETETQRDTEHTP